MRTAELVNRKLPASKSGVSCTSGFAGTALRRMSPDPPRTCRSGSILTSWPAVARATKGSATSGTSPGARTETVSTPPAASRPSETTSATLLAAPSPPCSSNTTVPSAVDDSSSGPCTEAEARKNGSPSGSTQSPSTAVVTRPPLSTAARFVALLHGRRVLLGVAHGHGDAGVRRAAAAVADGVAERDRSGCRVVERQLQLLVVRHQVDPRAGRQLAVDPVHDEDVAVRVVVVEEHREQRRPPRPRAELVVDGHRRHLGLLDRRLGLGVVLLDRLVVPLVREQGVPVVDEPVVVGCRPGLAAAGIVQHQGVAVHEEVEGAGARRLGELDATGLLAGAGAHRLAGPRGVEASVVLDRRRRIARHVVGEHHGSTAVEADREEPAAIRDGDRSALERRGLQDRVVGGLEHAREVHLASLDPEGAGGRVEHDPVLVDRRDLHVRVILGRRQLPPRRDGLLVGRVDAGDPAGGGRVGEEDPGGVDGGHRAGAEGEHGVRVAVEFRERVDGRGPDIPAGRDDHAIPGERDRRVLGWHGDRLRDGRRRRVHDPDGRAVAVEHEHRRALLHHLGGGAAGLDDRVQLEHRGVRPPHGLRGRR